jgi:hypothetical protein
MQRITAFVALTRLRPGDVKMRGQHVHKGVFTAHQAKTGYDEAHKEICVQPMLREIIDATPTVSRRVFAIFSVRFATTPDVLACRGIWHVGASGMSGHRAPTVLSGIVSVPGRVVRYVTDGSSPHQGMKISHAVATKAVHR